MFKRLFKNVTIIIIIILKDTDKSCWKKQMPAEWERKGTRDKRKPGDPTVLHLKPSTINSYFFCKKTKKYLCLLNQLQRSSNFSF